MRTITEIRRAEYYGDPLTKGEQVKLARYQARSTKRRAFLAEQDRRDELAYQRAQREARQAEAEHRHQSALDAAQRIHQAA